MKKERKTFSRDALWLLFEGDTMSDFEEKKNQHSNKIGKQNRFRLFHSALEKAVFITVIYLVFGGLWIVLSDAIALRIYQSAEDLAWFSTVKGLAYVLITAALIFFLIYPALRGMQQATEESKEKEKLLTALFDSIPDLIFYKDRDSVYRGCNRAYEEYTGQYKEDILGKTDYELFDKSMAEEFYNVDRELIESKKYRLSEDPKANDKIEELKAMDIAADAIIIFANRHADELDKLANTEKDPQRKAELIEMARICRKVPANAPDTFHEMLQHYWFIHLGVITEVNPWDSFNPGRLDQHLYPFYKQETEKGSLTKESAIELLQSFWVKFNNHPAPPKMGVTALESNTYTDFSLINLGGLKEDGTDAVNELTYILLDVIEEMRILQPSSMVQLSRENPDKFIERAIKITKTGFGQPSIFNTDAIIKELVNQGKDLADARNGGASGCVETGAFGTESYILTGYFNLNKILEITLYNGTDPRTGKVIGLNTGDPRNFKTINELLDAYKKQLNYFTDIKLKGNLIIEKLFAEEIPVPFLSLIIEDCIVNGVDYNAGGARYNTSYVQGVGLGSITDNITSIQYNVFDKKKITMEGLLKAMDENFKGYEQLRHDLIYETPKYGNDDDYADQHAVFVFNTFYDAINGKPTYRGGKFRINMLPTTSHVYFGSVMRATPDGRKAFEPLSEGISPFQGADKKGPTAVLKSAAKIDHIKTGGTLLNQKFSPSFFKDEKSIEKLGQLVRSYFRMDGHHIQFNVVSAKTLRDAQKHPEKYTDLIVRVAGYSDYFNDLGEDLQNEIIRRTEHEEI